MASRSEKPSPPALTRPAPWVAVALALLAGVVVALRYPQQVTPLLDLVR